MKTFRLLIWLGLLGLLFSCSVHPRSYIQPQTTENMVVDVNRAETSRGFEPMIIMGVRGAFWGVSKLAETTAKPYANSYSQATSINDYYTINNGRAAKTYNKIVIKKYGDIGEPTKTALSKEITDEISKATVSRSAETALNMKQVLNPELRLSPEHALSGQNIFKEDEGEVMSFYSVIGIETDPADPNISRLALEDLRVFYSKTKIAKKNAFNAVLSISMEGQWMDKGGNPHRYLLTEQEFNLLNLQYEFKNQISKKIYTPWFLDLPIPDDIHNGGYGIVTFTVQLKEYDSKRAETLKKVPDILTQNKSTVIVDCTNLIKSYVK